MQKIKSIITITVIIICITCVCIMYFMRDKLKSNHQTAIATICDCYYGGRGSVNFSVEGKFEVNNKWYEASCQLSCQSLSLTDLKTKLINSKTLTVYYPQNPKINCLLLEKSVYDFYSVSIPDSLLKVTSFVKCE